MWRDQLGIEEEGEREGREREQEGETNRKLPLPPQPEQRWMEEQAIRILAKTNPRKKNNPIARN
jgi:hypothetical protein